MNYTYIFIYGDISPLYTLLTALTCSLKSLSVIFSRERHAGQRIAHSVSTRCISASESLASFAESVA